MISRGIAAWLLIVVFGFPAILSAGAPIQLNHQGRLLDASDNPVSNASYTIIFSLYTEPDAGSPIWTESQDVVTNDGLFSVMLGTNSPLDLSLFDNDSLFLQMQLAGEPALLPRLRVGTVPTAATSQRVLGDIHTSPDELVVGDLDGDAYMDFHLGSDVSEMSVARKRPGRTKYSNITLRAEPDSVTDYRDCDSDDDGVIDSRMVCSLGHGGGGGGGAGGSLWLEADVDGDGLPDVGTESSARADSVVLKSFFERGDKPTQSQFSSVLDATGARLAINSKGTSAKREISSSTDEQTAVHSIEADLDGDGVADFSVSSSCDDTSAQEVMYKKGINAVNVSLARSIATSPGGSRAIDALDLDSDDDGVMDRTISSVCDGGGAESVVHAHGTGGSYTARLRVTDADGDQGTEMRCAADVDNDGVDDNDASLTVTPVTSSVAIKTKGTGADANRSASASSSTTVGEVSTVCAVDDDGDGVPEGEITQIVLPSSSSMAIKTKGTGADKNRVIGATDDTTASVFAVCESVSVSMASRKGWDGTVKGNLVVDNGADRMIDMDSDGDGYFHNAIGVGMDPVHRIDVAGGAYCDGTNWVNASDVNVKENFESVDGQEMLDRISQLEISKWNYKLNTDGMKHIGPTAQDFQRVFGVGSDGKTISTIDPAGIALAAIKELRKENIALDDKIAELTKQVEELKVKAAANDELRAQVQKLATLVETVMASKNSENDAATKLTSSH